jgi:hypothetical protein
MKVLDVKNDGYKGEYYASVEFAKTEGGSGEYRHKHMTTGEVRWEVVAKNPNGSFKVSDMSEAEYRRYCELRK